MNVQKVGAGAKGRAMTKEKLLDVLMVISALESWAYAQKAAFPDYLIEEVAKAVEALKEAILKGE